jgi:hypothetical protein
MMSDDVIAVTLSEDQVPMVSPSYPQQKLWQESIRSLGMVEEHYQPLFERETKFAVPVASQFYPEPLPLAGVVELLKGGTVGVHLLDVKGLERFQMLTRHTYRNFVLERCGWLEWHFGLLASFIPKISVRQLIRPNGVFTANHMADMILNDIQKEG